jgi:PTH1 family peptidyl-tRNA hydrolase
VPQVKLVVGLGNPGRKYERTRHNVGFDVVDELARRAGSKFRRGWLTASSLTRVEIEGCTLLLAKPQTFMNRSGNAVTQLLRKKGLEPFDVIVVFDDVELDLGLLRLRKKGGAGGHNGLRSVLEQLGTEDFPRVRVGIGPRPDGAELVQYVLSPFSSSQREAMEQAVGKAADAVVAIVRDGIDQAMNEFN